MSVFTRQHSPLCSDGFLLLGYSGMRVSVYLRPPLRVHTTLKKQPKKNERADSPHQMVHASYPMSMNPYDIPSIFLEQSDPGWLPSELVEIYTNSRYSTIYTPCGELGRRLLCVLSPVCVYVFCSQPSFFQSWTIFYFSLN